jgi:hypothetical protein
MNLKTLALGALLVSGSALAQEVVHIDTVVVRGSQDPKVVDVMNFDCNNVSKPSPSEVDALLHVADKGLLPKFADDIAHAVGDACTHGLANIVVERAPAARSLRWFAAEPGVIVETPVYYEIP